jgi:hypothetical protein
MSKKIYFICFLALILLFLFKNTLPSHSLLYAGEETLSIKTGTSFGHCMGYCRQEFVVTKNKIVYTQIPNLRGAESKSVPVLKQELPISNKQWIDLLKVNDMAAFKQLPNTIGCPDCADGGAEWIEVNKLDHTDPKTLKRFYSSKKVSFEYGKPLPANNTFAVKLRNLRTEIIKQYSKN